MLNLTRESQLESHYPSFAQTDRVIYLHPIITVAVLTLPVSLVGVAFLVESIVRLPISLVKECFSSTEDGIRQALGRFKAAILMTIPVINVFYLFARLHPEEESIFTIPQHNLDSDEITENRFGNQFCLVQVVELVIGQDKERSFPQKRTTPPLSFVDTIIMRDGVLVSAHSIDGVDLFSDDEIIEKLDILNRVPLGNGIYANYTEHGKAIIQQQAIRGCTAATAAMLIVDNHKEPNLTELQSRNLGDNTDITNDLQNAGLIALESSANNLLELRELLIRNGSSIIGINGQIGAHSIIIDEVSEDLSSVRLRDPFHGWEITTTSEAFLKEWSGGSTIQVQKD